MAATIVTEERINFIMKPFVNPIDFAFPITDGHTVVRENLRKVHSSAFRLPHLVSPLEQSAMLSALAEVDWQPVSITGMSGNYEPGDYIGSYRASSLQEKYAEALSQRIQPHVPSVKICDDSTASDWDGHRWWKLVGVNPLLRFIKYLDGGYLVSHYDAPYIANSDTRTLTSLVIYLDHSPQLEGGAVRYLKDVQAHLPVDQRDLSDSLKEVSEEDVRVALLPDAGTGIVFDHRILHDSQKVRGEGAKIICRTDLMYTKVSEEEALYLKGRHL